MAYLVNKTDGTLLATLLDGQIDRTHASLALIGKQVTNYGEIQNENFIRLAENFSSAIDPANPIEGQMWWDSSADTMQVFDGTVWRPVTGFVSLTSTPVNSNTGDQWWDPVKQQYSVYNGTEWVLIGPVYSAQDGKTGALVENVLDTGDVNHTIIAVYHNDVRTAIISSETFTPKTAIAGFAVVAAGMSFNATDNSLLYNGTATNSRLLGNLAPAQYLRSDVDTVATGRVSVRNALTVGPTDELEITFSDYENSISSVKADNDVSIKVSPAGILTRALTVSGSNGLVTLLGDPVTAKGAATKNYTDNTVAATKQLLENRITADVADINSSITALSALVNAKETAIYNNLAPKASPVLTGVPQAPTAVAGTNTNQIASTAFVNQSITNIDYSRIYNGTSSVKVNSTSIVATVAGITVATATAAGINTITQAAGDAGPAVATTAFVDRGIKNFVLNSTKYQPTCYVSSSVPNNSTGNDGDFWFQYV